MYHHDAYLSCTFEWLICIHLAYVRRSLQNNHNMHHWPAQTVMILRIEKHSGEALKPCMLSLRSFQIGTVVLCRSTGCKVKCCQSWRIILLSRNGTKATHSWFEVGWVADFFSNLQLWQIVTLQQVDLQRPTKPL